MHRIELLLGRDGTAPVEKADRARTIAATGPMRLLLAMVFAGILSAAQALEINDATRAQLEQLRGIGVDTAERILNERARAPFRDWADLGKRVKGLRGKRAVSLDAQGLTVNGQGLTAPAGDVDGRTVD